MFRIMSTDFFVCFTDMAFKDIEPKGHMSESGKSPSSEQKDPPFVERLGDPDGWLCDCDCKCRCVGGAAQLLLVFEAGQQWSATQYTETQ